ncbi:MAG TPA: hypothetical protein VMV44_06405 [Rectinemataceae bacterium]|nr:hypothetical protein [Rectinemataceae bacterium]
MNQDQVKELLLRTADAETDFSLVFSGKESSLVNGLYKPRSREIILHNRNFASDEQLVYTALHEYAHHLHCERKGFAASGRAHTNEFWGIFHDLLVAAESKGFYQSPFDREPEFIELTRKIRETCIEENGRVMLEFGRLLIEAQALCERWKTRFEDYLDRALAIPRVTAGAAAKAAGYGIDPSLGWDGMKLAAGIRDPMLRNEAIESLRGGMSPAAVRARVSPSRPPEDGEERLLRDKARIERSIERLSHELEEIENRLREIAP